MCWLLQLIITLNYFGNTLRNKHNKLINSKSETIAGREGRIKLIKLIKLVNFFGSNLEEFIISDKITLGTKEMCELSYSHYRQGNQLNRSLILSLFDR